MSETTKKKAPSPRVIAAILVVRSLEMDMSSSELTEHLSAIAGSKVNAPKADKVVVQYERMIKKQRERAQKIVDRYENPPPKSEAQKKNAASFRSKIGKAKSKEPHKTTALENMLNAT